MLLSSALSDIAPVRGTHVEGLSTYLVARIA